MEPVQEARARPRVLLVVDSLQVAGGERHVVHLATALRVRGYRVEVACSYGGPLESELAAHHIPVHVLMRAIVKRRVSPVYAVRLTRLLARKRFDIVHGHIFASQTAGAVGSLLTRTPLVITEHSEGSWKRNGAHALTRLVYRRAAGIIAVSNRLARSIGPAAITIPNCLPIDCDEVVPARLRPRGWEPCIGVVARLHPEKGVTTFLHAAKILLQTVPRCTFVVVGDGPERQQLEDTATRLGIRHRVTFLGFQSDISHVLSTLDILTVPSWSEGTPFVVLEGMVAGVPMVVSEVGGMVDQIRHGVDGLIVPPRSPSALAAAWQSVLSDPEQAETLACSARTRVVGEFDHGRMVDAVEDLYSQVLRDASERPSVHGSSVRASTQQARL